MMIKSRPRQLLAVLLAASLSVVAVAAPAHKITGVKMAGAKMYAIVQAGSSTKQVDMPGAITRWNKFLIGENGNALLYESMAKGPGGYEGEKAAVRRYHVGGKNTVVLDEPFNLDRIREYRSRRRRTAYVISMSDGGAGIPRVYVCSTRGKVWSKESARVAGYRNGKLIVHRYVRGEASGYEDAKPIGTLYLDLDKVLG